MRTSAARCILHVTIGTLLAASVIKVSGRILRIHPQWYRSNCSDVRTEDGAMVVENREQWYMDDGRLTKEICEEVQEGDEPPTEIRNCCACDEAKYEVTFEGMWSRHTHPKNFPTNEWLTHFSDIIGASHSSNYRVWEYGGISSSGLQQVAEWGSTRTLESELKRQSDHIRTIIKARGLWHPNVNGKTFAVFRVDNRHHLMSLVSMLGPSPDWIVGVSGMELCLSNCTWLDKKTKLLYPWDAGTDSGVTYESANIATIPRGKIRRISNSHPADPQSPFYDPTGLPMKPLAKLTITRQRVYEKSCGDTTLIRGPEISFEGDDDDRSRPECNVSSWSHWTPCSATCFQGFSMRSRSYIMPMKAKMMDCHRQLEEREVCDADIHTCPGGNPVLIGAPPVVDGICAMTEWSPWGQCSETCGKGHRMRQRRYLDRMGRKKCHQETTQKEECMADIPVCPIESKEQIRPECSVTPWSDWSPCSVTCGEGTTERARQYLVPSEAQSNCAVKTLDRKACFGRRRNCTFDPSEREEVCNQEKSEGPCRAHFRRWYYDVGSGICKEFKYGGCRGTLNNFKNLDECNNLCVSRASPDIHRILPDSHRSDPQPASYLEKVDCKLSSWSRWTQCSVLCGEGTKTKERTIEIHPQNGGKKCRRLHKTKKCNRPCKDSFSGLQSFNQLREEPHVPPLNPVPHSHQKHHAAHRNPYGGLIAPSLFNPSLEELEPPTIHLYGPPETHHFDDGTKVDCQMSEWGPWTPCTHTCGTEALQQRSRTVIESPRNGGAPCGNRIERHYCTLPPCPPTRTSTWGVQVKNSWRKRGV